MMPNVYASPFSAIIS